MLPSTRRPPGSGILGASGALGAADKGVEKRPRAMSAQAVSGKNILYFIDFLNIFLAPAARGTGNFYSKLYVA
jgi:hypothetical protein